MPIFGIVLAVELFIKIAAVMLVMYIHLVTYQQLSGKQNWVVGRRSWSHN